MTFRRVRDCTRLETIDLAHYLVVTPVAGYAPPLRAGTLVASAIEVAGRADLGETWSIFGNLGGIRAPAAVGRPKFLVREIREILNRPDCTDARSRARLDALIAAEASGTLADRRITIALTTAGPIIVDGNKRAAAIYELARFDVLSAFLIESVPGSPLLAAP
jgi:hypothetical protein